MVAKASKTKRNGHVHRTEKESGEARRCPVSDRCGGCSRIEAPYAEQLAAKDAAVAELFSGPEFARTDIRPILGMDNPFHYRDKVTSPFAPGRGGTGTKGGRGTRDASKGGPKGGREILTGMYAAGSHRIIPTDACLLENEYGQRVVAVVKSLMLRFGIAPYDEDRGTGFIRHVVVRIGHESGEVLVTIVTNESAFPRSKQFCRELARRCPFVTTIVQNVNTRQTNVILGDREQRLYGPGFILDTLCGLSFRISSQSFYQVNAAQTTVLYESAMQLAGLTCANLPEPAACAGTLPRTCRVAVDAYCGTGTIGLVAASRGAEQVIGMDSVESAIRDARENARHNGIGNARFVVGDAGDFMRGLADSGEGADLVFMDPPRAGSSEEFLTALAQLAPQRIVYISCNPTTQVRDLRFLAERGFSAETLQPIDMFPHTDHIETVALLVPSPK